MVGKGKGGKGKGGKGEGRKGKGGEGGGRNEATNQMSCNWISSCTTDYGADLHNCLPLSASGWHPCCATKYSRGLNTSSHLGLLKVQGPF